MLLFLPQLLLGSTMVQLIASPSSVRGRIRGFGFWVAGRGSSNEVVTGYGRGGEAAQCCGPRMVEDNISLWWVAW